MTQEQNQPNPLVLQYLEQLSPAEKKALQIAQEHLKSSFHIERSNGFQEWFATFRKSSDKSHFLKK
jgi:hypothetical protein